MKTPMNGHKGDNTPEINLSQTINQILKTNKLRYFTFNIDVNRIARLTVVVHHHALVEALLGEHDLLDAQSRVGVGRDRWIGVRYAHATRGLEHFWPLSVVERPSPGDVIQAAFVTVQNGTIELDVTCLQWRYLRLVGHIQKGCHLNEISSLILKHCINIRINQFTLKHKVDGYVIRSVVAKKLTNNIWFHCKKQKLNENKN